MFLINNNFKKISWSNLFAQFAEQIALSAAPLVAVLLLSATASETAWIQTSQTLPFLLLSIPAGLIVDRISKRNLMIGAEIMRAISLITLFLLLISSSMSLILLSLLGFIGAIGTVCYNVASPAYVPTLIPKSRLISANRWLELSRSIAYSGGPALGGAIVGYIGAPVAYIVATTLSILAFMLLMSLPKEAPQAKVNRHILQDLAESAGFIIHHRYLRPILLTAVFFNISWFIVQGIYVAYAATRLELNAAQIGFTIGIYGMGMIAGAFSLKYLVPIMPYGLMIVLGPLGGLIAAIMMLLTICFPYVYLAGFSYFLFGAGPTIWTIITVSLRQSVTPENMMGRVSAFFLTTTFGARPIGSAIAALLAVNYGVESCLWVAVIGFVIQLIILLISEVPRLHHLNEAV
ncbi:MFS transporter [Pragia fontium]|uniref:Predicted arabinose efflux permease, MFS family n=1 Tax=Pragia fontium DSM 5563 = ATCC 49100 TaxID=1122977 RepID=A0AAJ4WDG8_9GAMM|nr:MFS transporter [Pragia fontium]SFD41986.1 Predicted arabinose efflux permease, MFS family [Pragia fontium DSM 5563 = ATCC 49100]VEJ55501.1 enterobactin exporter EntS [Pragia fontium]